MNYKEFQEQQKTFKEFATNSVAYTEQPNNGDNKSPAALITELLRSRVCNPLARSAGVLLGVVEDFLGLHTCNLKANLIRRAGAGAAGHGTYKASFLRKFKDF